MEAEWVAVLIAVLGMIGSLVAALWSNTERRRADDAAERAESRAEEAVAALQGIESAVAGPAVIFEVRHRGGDQYELVNGGHSRATGVRAEAVGGYVAHDLPDGTDLEPGEGHLIFVVQVQQLRVACDQFDAPRTVTVPRKPR